MILGDLKNVINYTPEYKKFLLMVRCSIRDCSHVVSQEDQPFNTPDIHRETGLTQSSIIQIIHRNLGLKCLVH